MLRNHKISVGIKPDTAGEEAPHYTENKHYRRSVCSLMRSSSPAKTLSGRKEIFLMPFIATVLLATLYCYTRAPLVPRLPAHSKGNNKRYVRFTPTRSWKSNRFTVKNFDVAGVNLASYGLGGEETKHIRRKKPFELFDDFNLADQLTGNETWKDLVRYRRDAKRPSLSFFVDKIARKRWLPSVGVLGSQPFVLKYASELTDSGSLDDEREAILRLLPKGIDYAAKPNHLSCSGGVWLTKNLLHDGGPRDTTLIGHGMKPMEPFKHFKVERIADSLAEDLHKKAKCHTIEESWALKNVEAGLVVEERFASWENDDRGGMEFKVFTIWGRMWLAVWRPGVGDFRAFLHRNGTNLHWAGQNDALPDWINWQRIVDIAEQLGAHKDMFRTDIFVGIPAGSPTLRNGATLDERLGAIKYVVSECEIHPTPIDGTDDIFDEGGRLWLAGYEIGNYRVVSDTEVPPEFLKKSGALSTKTMQ